MVKQLPDLAAAALTAARCRSGTSNTAPVPSAVSVMPRKSSVMAAGTSAFNPFHTKWPERISVPSGAEYKKVVKPSDDDSNDRRGSGCV